jgi:membrane protein implicated in regulation of membrane protease activity
LDDPELWRWIWLIAAGVFTAGEMAVAGSFFLAPFAVGAAAATVLAFAGAPVVAQWLVFVLLSGLTFAAFRPLARRLDANAPNHSVGATRLVSRPATVIEDIPAHGIGLVRVDREEWRAETEHGHALESGAAVTIVEVRGTRLIVTPAGRPTTPYTPPGLPGQPPPLDAPSDPPPPAS